MGGKIYTLRLKGCPTVIDGVDFLLCVEHTPERARQAAENQLPSSGAWLQADTERLAANDLNLPAGIIAKGHLVE